MRLSRRRSAPPQPPGTIAGDAAVPLIAVNDVLYHEPERRPLQDVVTCIREHLTIETPAGGSKRTPSGI